MKGLFFQVQLDRPIFRSDIFSTWFRRMKLKGSVMLYVIGLKISRFYTFWISKILTSGNVHFCERRFFPRKCESSRSFCTVFLLLMWMMRNHHAFRIHVILSGTVWLEILLATMHDLRRLFGRILNHSVKIGIKFRLRDLM